MRKSKPSLAPIEEDDETTAKILFAGDIMLARSIEDKIEKEDDVNYPFEQVYLITAPA